MKNEEIKCITLDCKMFLSHPKYFPSGITGKYHADIIDEIAFWTFRNLVATRFLINILQDKNTRFDISKKCGVTLYHGKTKEEIKELLSKELKKYRK